MLNKNSAPKDILVDTLEEIANVFFADKANGLETVLSGELGDPIFDMGIPYHIFTNLVIEAYGMSEDDLLDNLTEMESTNIFISSMEKRDTFEIDDVKVMYDPYDMVVLRFNTENLVEC